MKITALLALTALTGCLPKTTSPSLAPGAKPIAYVDTHAHLKAEYHEGGHKVADYELAAELAIERMDRLGAKRVFLMPPPFAPGNPRTYTFETLKPVIERHPDRFSMLGGGGLLNPIIQRAVRAGTVTDDMRLRFTEAAGAIVDAGAVGFGELTAMHFSFNKGHPYEEAPPDHPLFLLLADISAQTGLPIDLHIEMVPKAMKMPRRFGIPPNPERLSANRDAFERLLAYNRDANIVWVHVGWDNTGGQRFKLLDTLLSEHSNLYMSLKNHWHGRKKARPLLRGSLRTKWADLIAKHPDRFLVGCDHFFGIPGKTRKSPESAGNSRRIINGLPPDLARRVAIDNTDIYPWRARIEDESEGAER